jgi:hypothetical protein
MNKEKKLKPIAVSFLLLLHVFILAVFIIIRIIYNADTVFIIGAVINIVGAFWSLFLSVRTKNLFFIVLFLFFLFLTTANFIRVFYSVSVAEYFLFIALLFGIWMIYILIKKKVKSRAREVLELAARPVTETEDGFTSRPYLSGQIDFSTVEINTFSKFLLKHLIALPYFKKDKVIFLIEYKLAHLLYFRDDYSNLTHIVFKNDGNIIVNISQKYYKKYKEELTFDKLCKSFGELFNEFYELHKQGHNEKIIERMNAQKEIL